MAFRSFTFCGVTPGSPPLTGLTPAVRIVDRAGVTQAVTTAVEFGAGTYAVTVSAELKAMGVIVLVDGGPSAFNRYQVAAVADDGLFPVQFQNPDGTPFDETSALPTWGVYFFPDGSDHLADAPAWVPLVDGAYCCTIPPLHLAVGVALRVVAPPGTSTEFLTSTVVLDGALVVVQPPPATPAPAVEVTATTSPAPVPYQTYQARLAPPWLRGASGEAWLRALGDAKDEVELRTREAVKARWPSWAPQDALAPIAADRGIDRGAGEDDAAYRLRLRDAWSIWPWAGTATGVLRALKTAGYTDVWLVGGTGRYATLDGLGNVVFTDGSPLSIGASNLWNAIRLVFPTLPAGWSPTLPAEFSDEVQNIRRIVMKWKSAVALFEGITVIQSGHTWGFPATLKWGQPGLMWGDSVITSWAGAH